MGTVQPPSPRKSRHLKRPGNSARVSRNLGRRTPSFIILQKNFDSDDELEQESKAVLCKADSLLFIPQESLNFQSGMAKDTPNFPQARQQNKVLKCSPFDLGTPGKIKVQSQHLNHSQELLREMRKKSDDTENDLPKTIILALSQDSPKKPVVSIGGSSYNDNPFRLSPVSKSFGNSLAIDPSQTAKFNAESRDIIGSHDFDDKIMQGEKNPNKIYSKLIKRRLSDKNGTLEEPEMKAAARRRCSVQGVLGEPGRPGKLLGMIQRNLDDENYG